MGKGCAWGSANAECVHRIVQRQIRDECLIEHWFTTLAHTRAVIAAWRRDYNEQCTALNYRSPSEIAAKH